MSKRKISEFDTYENKKMRILKGIIEDEKNDEYGIYYIKDFEIDENNEIKNNYGDIDIKNDVENNINYFPLSNFLNCIYDSLISDETNNETIINIFKIFYDFLKEKMFFDKDIINQIYKFSKEYDIGDENEFNSIIENYILELETGENLSLNLIKKEYDEKYSDYNSIFEKNKIDNVLKKIDTLDTENKNIITDIFIDDYCYEYDIEINDINRKLFMELFDNSEIDDVVQFVKLNSKEIKNEENEKEIKEYYKIYKNSDKEDIKKYAVKFNKPYSIYFLIYLRERYIVINVNLDNKLLNFEIENDIDIKEIKNIIKNKLHINIKNERIINMVCDFNIYDIEIFEGIFIKEVINNILFKNYLHINEDKNPYYKKSKIKFHLNDEKLSFNICQLFIKNRGTFFKDKDEMYDYFEKNNKEVVVRLKVKNETKEIIRNEGDKYIHIKISKVKNIESVKKFIKMFNCLINEYEKNKNKILKEYKELIENYTPTHLIVKSIFDKYNDIKVIGEHSVANLKIIAPDLIPSSGYGTSFKKSEHPMIFISKEDMEEWVEKNNPENNTYDEIKNREGEVKYYFLCPNKSNPFPMLIDNEYETNINYDKIPICSKTKKRIKYGTGNIGYIHTKIDGILEFENLGVIDVTFKAFLIKEFNLNIDTKIYRKGVDNSLKSLFYCLCYLDKKVTKYNILKNNYIKNKNKVINNFNFNILKQEMYDKEIKDMKCIIEDEDKYIDSKDFIRLFEEFYNVNIFIFYKDEDEINIEIPNYSYLHIPNKNPDRKNVIIYKNKGTKSQKYKFYIYNILVFEPEIKDNKLIFTKLNMYYEKICENIIAKVEKNKFILRKNLLMQDFLKGIPITHQFIDKRGKAVKFLLDSGVIIETFPTYPRNLPIFEPLIMPTKESVIKIFGIPNKIENFEDNCIGFWYKYHDIEKYIYTPVQKFKPINNRGLLEYNKYNYNEIDVFCRIRELKMLMNKLTQIYKWIFIILLNNENVENLFDVFEKKYITVNTEEVEDTLKYYNFNNLDINFPVADNDINLTLKKLYMLTINIVKFEENSYKLNMYNNKFKDKIIYFLKRFYIDYMELKFEIPKKFYFNYNNIEDFKKQKDVIVILNNKDFNSWINENDRGYIIKEIINEDDDNNPIIYHLKNKNLFYIIQKTKGFENAINISYNWYKNKINLGYNSPKYVYEYGKNDNKIIYPYIIYIIKNKKLKLKTGNIFDDKNYLEILEYGENKYASMLRFE